MESQSVSTRSPIKPLLVFGGLLVLAIGWLLYLVTAPEHVATPATRPVPTVQFTAFELEPLLGASEPISSAEFTGRITLVNFWGPWCTYCRVEMPELASIQRDFSVHPKFRFVSISCSSSMSDDHDQGLDQLRHDTKAYVGPNNFTWPIYCDPLGKVRKEFLRVVLPQDNSFAYPTTAIIDEKGFVHGPWCGYGEGLEAELRETLQGLLVGSTFGKSFESSSNAEAIQVR